MVRLILNNSRSQVCGLTTTQLAQLRDLLSIKTQGFGSFVVRPDDAPRLIVTKHDIVMIRDLAGVLRPVFGRNGRILKAKSKVEACHAISRTRLTYRGEGIKLTPLMDKRGIFGTGLVYLASGWMKKKGIEFKIEDLRKRPETIYKVLGDLRLPITPYPEQIEAAKALCARYRGIVSAPTAFGKSFIIALAISMLRVKSLVVVPTVALREQLLRDLSDWFPPNTVGTLIQVKNVDALDPKAPSNADLVIVDEFHHSAAKTYRLLNNNAWKGVFYRLGLTATPFRTDEDERLLLESFLSRVIYRVTYRQAVEKGYICPLEAYYVDLPKVKCSSDDYKAVYDKLVIEREDRIAWIADFLSGLQHANRSALCLVKEIRHGEMIQARTLDVPFVTGVNANPSELIEKFNRGDHPMIGTEGICGEGVNTRPCEFVIIAGLGKSKGAFMQKVGRTLRRYPGKESGKVIIFRDPSHRFTLDHFNAQCQHLRDEYGVSVTKLEV